MTSHVTAALAAIALSATPVNARAGDPLFLVGAPVGSLQGELAELGRLGRFCALPPTDRDAKLKGCLRAPVSADAGQKAAALLCSDGSVELGHPEAQRLVLQALTACSGGLEGVVPTEAVRGTTLLGPGGLESALVGGLADFVVDRARTESIDFAFDQIEEVLCREPAARELFPALCALSSAAEQLRMALVPGRMLHDAVVSDLRALPRHLADRADRDEALGARRELSCALRLADAVGAGLERREPPLNLALAAATRATEACACRALLDGETPCDEGTSSHSDAAQALLLAVKFAVARAGEPLAGGSGLFLPVGTADLREAVARAPVKEGVRRLAGPAAEALLGPALRIRLAMEAYLAADASGRAGALPELLASSVDFVGAAIDLALAMRPVTPAVIEQRRRLAGAVAMARHALGGEYAAALTDLVASGLIDPSRQPYASLLRVSSLAVEVGSARSSAEVAQALETAAAPSGSWRLRRKKSVWGLTAKVGVAVSEEWVQGSPGAPVGTVLGFHAPVGLDASWPLGQRWVLGGMVQVVDLGSLVGARVGGGQGEAGVKDLPKAGFAQVFAPGGSIFLGLGRSPFVLSIGASYCPGLRPVSDGGDARSVWRVTAGLAVDVPILIW